MSEPQGASASSPASAQPTNPAVGRVKAKRTRTGCLVCRSRKIKCDERPGTCENCIRASLPCRWATTSNKIPVSPAAHREHGPTSGIPAFSAISPSSLASENVTSTTCRACRVVRSQCSNDRPTCLRCQRQGITCDYSEESNVSGDSTVTFQNAGASSVGSSSIPYLQTPSSAVPTGRKRKKSDPAPSGAEFRSSMDEGGVSPGHDLSDVMDRRVSEPHIKAYFEYVSPVQGNAFIHQPSLLRDLAKQQVSRRLLLALCALSNRFLPQSPPSAQTPPTPGLSNAVRDAVRARAWAKEAKTLCVTADEMSPDLVTTALLLARHDVYMARYSSAWLMVSIANRAATVLGLHQEMSGDVPWVERETRRRLFWACYCLDRTMSDGKVDYILTDAEVIRIRLPCEEHSYLLGIQCYPPIPVLERAQFDRGSVFDMGEEQHIGMFGHHVQILSLRFMVLRYTRHSKNVADPSLPPWHPSSSFNDFSRQVSQWYRSLLPHFCLLPDTIFAREAHGQLSALIMLHVWYEQTMCDLYRIAMPGFPESLVPSFLATAPAGWVVETRQACISHARGVGNVLRRVGEVTEFGEVEILDPSLPICVFESVRVQLQGLFTFQESNDPERVSAFLQEAQFQMSVVERMPKSFQQANWLLKEARRLLYRHGLLIGTEHASTGDASGAQTPIHPWAQRIRQLRSTIETQPQTQSAPTSDNLSSSQLMDLLSAAAENPSLAFAGTQGAYTDLNGAAGAHLASGANQPNTSAVLDELDQMMRPLDAADPLNFLGMLDLWTATGE